MEKQKYELIKLGYEIVSESSDEVVAVQNKWLKSAAMTNLTYIVFLRKVPSLTAAVIDADRDRMFEAAKTLDPSSLPRGAQHGRAVIPFYISETISDDAKQLCSSKQPMKFSMQFFPVAFNPATDQAFYLAKSPAWGGFYYPSFQFLAQHLAYQDRAPEKPESPLSVFYKNKLMMALMILIILMLLCSCFSFFMAAILGQ